MIAKQSNKRSISFPVYHHLGISVPAHSPAAAHMRIKNAPPETPITNQRSACDWERRSKEAGGWPFAKQKAEAKQTLLRRGGGWIRFSAEKPRRWKRATGAFPRAAFRIHNKKRPTCWRDVCWWRRVDSNHRSESQQIYSLPPLATRELLHVNLFRPAQTPSETGGGIAPQARI